MIISIFANSCLPSRKYFSMEEIRRIYRFESITATNSTNDWDTILELLLITDITFIFILTNEQISSTKMITSDSFKPYKIHESEPITNPNYPEQPGRLKVYIFKGKGEPYEV